MPSLPRIDQVLPSYTPHDAIGSETKLIKTLLTERGFPSSIFAEQGFENGARPINEYHALSGSNNILIHHFSIGSDIPVHLLKCSSYFVTRYHNITPSYFFSEMHNRLSKRMCERGRIQLPLVKLLTQTCWPASSFNAKELHDFCSDTQSETVLPVLRKYYELRDSYPSQRIQKFLNNGRQVRNILFVGRIIPSKAQHDLIFHLKQYKDFVASNVRLILVGGWEKHYGEVTLKNLATNLGLTYSYEPKTQKDFNADILFTGSVPENELVSYYQNADLFMCMSDHEGFCVPLVEAMTFGLPILAHEEAAIPETAGNAAWFVKKNDPVHILEGMHALLNDNSVRKEYIEKSLKRAEQFSWKTLVQKFDGALDKLLKLHTQKLYLA